MAMGDVIKLPRSVSGTKLMEAIEDAASKLGWYYEKLLDHYSVSPGSAKVEPGSFQLNIKTRRILGNHVKIFITPELEYKSITLYGTYGFNKKNLEMFATTLYSLLGQ
jgi:hypothetical protein